MAVRMPVIFVAHGAPMLLDDAGWVGELGAWADALPRPSAILIVSAHWEARPATLGATTPVAAIHDFHGFPERFYRLTYPAPGAPALAGRVRALLTAGAIPSADAPTRGLDHGAYVPLLCMYPAADVPVLQLSLPSVDPGELVQLGNALAPLREEGILLVASGFLTHNMRAGFAPGVPPWARAFDTWVEGVLARGDHEALIDFAARAPSAAMALPTTEHFAPLLVAIGAAGKARVTFPIQGFWNETSFSRRSVQLD